MTSLGVHVAPVTGPADGLAGLPGPALLVGAGTPPLSPALLDQAGALLERFDAVVGPTSGTGWWAFGLREPRHAIALSQSSALGQPGAGSVPDTLAGLALAMLRLGLHVAMLPPLTAVEAAQDVAVGAAA
jgi:glycosyltransferase A (GT-A) superfamily protein (DUF2064 family)